ncbi:hypothetical protein Tco_0232031 [Tanacetum coccineum]
MGDEHLDTISATESDEVIKSSVENLVPTPSEFEGISDYTSDVPNCDNNHVNVESDFVESLIDRDYENFATFQGTDRKKRTKIMTKPDETEHGIGKSARKQVQRCDSEGGGGGVELVMRMAAGVWGSDDGDGHEGGVMVAAVGRQPEEVESRGGE